MTFLRKRQEYSVLRLISYSYNLGFLAIILLLSISCKPKPTEQSVVFANTTGKGKPMIYVTFHPDRDTIGDEGQKNLAIYMYDGSSVKMINAWSGRNNEQQKYRKASDSVSGSNEPAPEGYYQANVNWTKPEVKEVGKRFFGFDFAPPTTQNLKPSKRTALGFHTYNDYENSKIPRSRGCIVMKEESELDQLAAFMKKIANGASTVPMIIDWELRSIKVPDDLRKALDIPDNFQDDLIASTSTISGSNEQDFLQGATLDDDLDALGVKESNPLAKAETTSKKEFDGKTVYCPAEKIQDYIDWGFGKATLKKYCSKTPKNGMLAYQETRLRDCLIEYAKRSEKADSSCQASNFLIEST